MTDSSEQGTNKYYIDRAKFIAYCLEIAFIRKDQISELESIYDTLKSNVKS